MANTLLIEEGPFETRAALLEESRVVEIQIERNENMSRVGAFYHGRIAKLLPDMDVAFVDLGPAGDGFLQLDDIPTKAKSVGAAVHEGEKLLVQVIKDRKGDKGVQLGRRFSLLGTHLIYRPLGKGLTLSKSINAPNDRARIESLLEIFAVEAGVTVRTSAQHVSEDELTAEIQALKTEWEEIQAEQNVAKKPGPLGRAETPLSSILKSLLSGDTDLIVNSSSVLNAAKKYFNRRLPGIQPKIELWTQQTPLFEAKGVEAELEIALQKRVTLESGANIILEPTEAAIIIDVNSAGQTRAAGRQSAALITNLEATLEICRQIRLRNYSGIIIIDFIQMNGKGEMQELSNALQTALDKDPVPTRLIGMTELGLMQITRKRSRPALDEVLCRPCPTCNGDRFIKSDLTVLAELYRALQNEVRFTRKARLQIETGARLASLIKKHQTQLESELARPITISVKAQLSDNNYQIG